MALVQRANRVVEAAALICEETRAIGLTTAVLLHRAAGPVGLAIDDARDDVTAEQRLFGTTAAYWDGDALLAALRSGIGAIGAPARNTPVVHASGASPGFLGGAEHRLAVAIGGPRGWFATICAGAAAPLVPSVGWELAMIATKFAVWCKDRGLGPLPAIAESSLDPRQRAIARRATKLANAREVAAELGIPLEAVEGRLAEVCRQLGISTQRDLAAMLRRMAPYAEARRGVTAHHGLTVTRAPDT